MKTHFLVLIAVVVLGLGLKLGMSGKSMNANLDNGDHSDKRYSSDDSIRKNPNIVKPTNIDLAPVQQIAAFSAFQKMKHPTIPKAARR